LVVTDGIGNIFEEDELRSNLPSDLHNPVEQATASASSQSSLLARRAEVLAWEPSCDEVVLTKSEGGVEGRDVVMDRYVREVFA
jgi:hypothetical protein